MPVSLVIFLLSSGPVPADTVVTLGIVRPDFSGRWISESENAAPTTPRRGAISDASRGARVDGGNDWGSDITLVQDGQKLTVLIARSRMQPPLKLVYALDGTESTNMVMVGGRLQLETARASWSEDRLVITTLQTSTGEVTRMLSLATPAQLVMDVTLAGVPGQPATTTQITYRKR